MPKNTFFNLPDEKREKLIEAVRREFARVPFSEVSINKIVQDAGIPRGSFYQYFDGKDDLLRFILLGYRERMLIFTKQRLISSGGDIFDLFSAIPIMTADFASNTEDEKICRNLFADIRVNTEFYLNLSKLTQYNIIDELSPYVNTQSLNLSNPDDFCLLLGILLSVCSAAIAGFFMNVNHPDCSVDKYIKQLELLKRSFTKIKENKINA